MNKMKYSITLIALLIITGCSTKYPVTIASNPAGAEVYCNGQSFGYAPVTRYFELDEATKEHGYLQTCQWQLRWVSGATAPTNYIFDLNKFPDGVKTTSPRPDVPGYQQDAEFALKVKQMQYQKRQAEAAEASAYEAERNNNKTTTCITNYGHTTCF